MRQTLADKEYRELFDRAPFGLALCTMDGKMVAVNRAFRKIVGWSVTETDEQLELSYWNITPEDYKEQEDIQVARLKERGTYGPYIKEYIHKKGHTVPVLLWGGLAQVHGGEHIWSTVVEVDNPWQLCMFDDAPYAIALTCFEPDDVYRLGDLVAVNKNFAGALGYSVDDVLKKSYWDLTPVSYKAQELEQLDKLKRDGAYGVYRKHYVHKDGDYVEVHLRGRVTQIKGRKFVWSFIEIGEKAPPSVRQPKETIKRPPSTASEDTELKRQRMREAIKPEPIRPVDGKSAKSG